MHGRREPFLYPDTMTRSASKPSPSQIRASHADDFAMRKELPSGAAAVLETIAELAPFRAWHAERFRIHGDPHLWEDWPRLAGRVKAAMRVMFDAWRRDPAGFVAGNAIESGTGDSRRVAA